MATGWCFPEVRTLGPAHASNAHGVHLLLKSMRPPYPPRQEDALGSNAGSLAVLPGSLQVNAPHSGR